MGNNVSEFVSEYTQDVKILFEEPGGGVTELFLSYRERRVIDGYKNGRCSVTLFLPDDNGSFGTFQEKCMAESGDSFVITKNGRVHIRRPIVGTPPSDVDDGSAETVLGLTTYQRAFRGTTGQWVRSGNGNLTIRFVSVDDQDVTVCIWSGGKSFLDVPVGRGSTVEVTTPLTDVAGKMLEMDRWRPGLLWLPGKGGGSFSLWVPNNTRGSLNLVVRINVTTFTNST